MTVFLVWVGLAFFFLGLYSLIVWKRAKKKSRFRAKLTIFFLLFVFIPTVPLTFFIAHLLTRSADLLLVPGIDDALNSSLETIKVQVEERGNRFLAPLENEEDWPQSLPAESDVDYVALCRLSADSILFKRSIHTTGRSQFQDWQLSRSRLLEAFASHRASHIFEIGDAQAILVYRHYADSTIGVAGYRVAPQILEAREKIGQALNIYSTLSLLKESIVQKNLIWALAVLLIVGLAALSITVSRRLSTGITEPIRALVHGMGQIADGDMGHRVDAKARDEFLFMIQSFNQMIEDLEQSRKKLIQAERLAAWQEVARQISHEMKNSLTPISLSLRRLRSYFDAGPLPQKVTESLQAIDEELRDMERMAAEFSEFARMPQAEKDAMDMNRQVISVVRLVEPSAGKVRLETSLQDDLPQLYADREQMKRLLINLIKNGVEASEEQGVVRVTTKQIDSPPSVLVEISDDGRGMDAETREKIFLPYYTTKKKGTGLGLALVQKIVEDHEGEIIVESEEGKGTTIHCLLPILK